MRVCGSVMSRWPVQGVFCLLPKDCLSKALSPHNPLWEIKWMDRWMNLITSLAMQSSKASAFLWYIVLRPRHPFFNWKRNFNLFLSLLFGIGVHNSLFFIWSKPKMFPHCSCEVILSNIGHLYLQYCSIFDAALAKITWPWVYYKSRHCHLYGTCIFFLRFRVLLSM